MWFFTPEPTCLCMWLLVILNSFQIKKNNKWLKRDKIIGVWRKVHNEELHNLYSSPNIIRMIKSRRMKWEGHIVRVVEKRNACRGLVGKARETTLKT
jgi:hypothetical protein